MEVIQYKPESGDPSIRNQIGALERTVWPSGAEDDFPSAPQTYLTSFVMMDQGEAVCHVGIRRCRFWHRGESYLAYGLSEVVTHPKRQGRGIGTYMIKKAAEWMETQPQDLSIFTCAPERVGFYERGGWHRLPGTCLVGGTKEKPFRSDRLGLIVMARFYSRGQRAKRTCEYAHLATAADIWMELGENQLW